MNIIRKNYKFIYKKHQQQLIQKTFKKKEIILKIQAKAGTKQNLRLENS